MKTMNIQRRMQRRRRNADEALVPEYEALSPVAHVADPVGRATALEALLDYLEPMLDGTLPPEAYVWGPPGAGKSAVVAALFTQLQSRQSRPGAIIHSGSDPNRERPQAFVYIDARSATTDFGLYHQLLDGLVEEPIPKRGVRTEAMLARVREALDAPDRRALVAVDHVGEPETVSLSELAERFDRIDGGLSWLAVGRRRPSALESEPPAERIRIPAYDQRTLVEIVTSRALLGLGPHTLTHGHSREIAAWADGSAHDALAALFVAADRAARRGRSTIRDADVTAALETTPRSDVSLGQVLCLPDSRRRVLRALLELEPAERSPVDSLASAIADGLDLSAGTVKRYLYELADDGIVERIRMDGAAKGRPPSRIEPRFPTRVFERLTAAQPGPPRL